MSLPPPSATVRPTSSSTSFTASCRSNSGDVSGLASFVSSVSVKPRRVVPRVDLSVTSFIALSTDCAAQFIGSFRSSTGRTPTLPSANKVGPTRRTTRSPEWGVTRKWLGELSAPGPRRALQGQRQLSPPHPEAEAPAGELASLRSGSAPARRFDGVVQRGGDCCLARLVTDQPSVVNPGHGRDRGSGPRVRQVSEAPRSLRLPKHRRHQAYS